MCTLRSKKKSENFQYFKELIIAAHHIDVLWGSVLCWRSERIAGLAVEHDSLFHISTKISLVRICAANELDKNTADTPHVYLPWCHSSSLREWLLVVCRILRPYGLKELFLSWISMLFRLKACAKDGSNCQCNIWPASNPEKIRYSWHPYPVSQKSRGT